MKITSSSPIQPMYAQTIEAMDDLDAKNPGTGKPVYFCVVGNQIRVHPAPSGNYTAELAYYSTINKLSASVASNWILASHPDAYLYGALLQAAPYLKDDERAGVWTGLYVAAIEAIKTADERAASSGGALVTRTASFGV